ncbi:MAG: ABC transporter permease subunit, partial [Candidatus Aminicenantes bacterium]|nr:ABC transporter permease subunit [Candidatus Aminicenantes bacterium]
RVLYLLLFFALVMIFTSRIASLLTVGEESKIIIDIGLSAISFFGVLMAVLIGITLVSREIEKKTIHNILSKPIRRYQFLLGKYGGLLLTILIMDFIMTLGLLLTLYVKSGRFEFSLLLAMGLFFCELLIITAFAIFFSTFTTPILSSVFTLAVYIVGHLSWNLLALKERITSFWGKALCTLLYYLLPNLENFNIKNEVVHQLSVGWKTVFLAIGYGISYSVVIILLATLIVQRKDFV